MQTISRIFLLIGFVLLVLQNAVPASSMLVRPLNLEEVVEIIADNQGMYKNRVENDIKFFEIPTLLSCERENAAENEARKFKIYSMLF